MAGNSASSIRTALNTYLSAVTQLQEVAIGKSTEPTGFPFCRFYLTSVSNDLLDNAPTYYREYSYTIEIWQEHSNKTKANAEADLEDAVDAVMDKLGTEWTLGDNAEEARIESGTIQEVETGAGPMLIASIPFSVKTLIS